MAELTAQGNIRLTHTNKFRIIINRNSRSNTKQQSFQNRKEFYKNKNLNNTLNFQSQNRKGQNLIRNQSDQQDNRKARYPQNQRFKRQLQKIGVLQKDSLKFTYEPEQNQMKQFRTSRLRSLRQKYLQKKYQYDNIAINSTRNPQYLRQNYGYQQQTQMDDAVLGCWKYGQKTSRQKVWKQYKQNLNMLNFDVLKIINKRRQRC